MKTSTWQTVAIDAASAMSGAYGSRRVTLQDFAGHVGKANVWVCRYGGRHPASGTDARPRVEAAH